MKIAHVSCVYPPYRGGIGHVAYEYVERLRARGHDAQAFTLSHDHAFANDPPHVRRLKALRVGNAGFAPSLSRALDGFDLVHLHYPFFGAAEFVAWNRARHPAQPLVVSYHMDAQADDWRGWFFAAYRKTLFPWILRQADRVFVSSRDYAASSELAGVRGIGTRIRELPFGVDTERFRPGDEAELRQSLGGDAHTPVILFVGGLDAAHHFKGFDVLLEALRPLAGIPWQLAVVGEGDLRATYEARVADFGLNDRVRFVGSASDADLPRYYRASDLFVFPSTSRAEAFGLVLLEAAACGVPAVVSDLPGVRTVVVEEKTGLRVPPRDAASLSRAIERLLKNPEERRFMGEAARARAVDQYAWDPLIDNMIEEYKVVIARSEATKQSPEIASGR